MDAWTAILVAAIGGLSGAGGAILASRIAAQQSKADREEARHVRFADVVRQLAAEVLRAGQTHMEEMDLQVHARIGIEPRSAADVPSVGSTEPMKLWAQELQLTARDPAMAKAALRFYATTAWMAGPFVYIAQRDRLPDGNARLLTDDQFTDFLRRQERWVRDRDAFVNAVRAELGAEPFAEGGGD